MLTVKIFISHMHRINLSIFYIYQGIQACFNIEGYGDKTEVKVSLFIYRNLKLKKIISATYFSLT